MIILVLVLVKHLLTVKIKTLFTLAISLHLCFDSLRTE